VQQDLALGALIGVTHAERNGHHYVDGFGRYNRRAEAEAFLFGRIPDLYVRDGNRIRLAIPRWRPQDGIADVAGLCNRRSS